MHLYLLDDAPGALRLAAENYQLQREPRDARILMEAALVANEPAAAKPALAWMRRTGYEDPLYKKLAQRLEGGAK